MTLTPVLGKFHGMPGLRLKGAILRMPKALQEKIPAKGFTQVCRSGMVELSPTERNSPGFASLISLIDDLKRLNNKVDLIRLKVIPETDAVSKSVLNLRSSDVRITEGQDALVITPIKSRISPEALEKIRAGLPPSDAEKLRERFSKAFD